MSQAVEHWNEENNGQNSPFLLPIGFSPTHRIFDCLSGFRVCLSFFVHIADSKNELALSYHSDTKHLKSPVNQYTRNKIKKLFFMNFLSMLANR